MLFFADLVLSVVQLHTLEAPGIQYEGWRSLKRELKVLEALKMCDLFRPVGGDGAQQCLCLPIVSEICLQTQKG